LGQGADMVLLLSGMTAPNSDAELKETDSPEKP
ncbi:phage minor tail protein G, partial [Salmonella enterica]|nr:phage minor tail protein G [Salmonella enterica]